jgi:hypothetical protein
MLAIIPCDGQSTSARGGAADNGAAAHCPWFWSPISIASHYVAWHQKFLKKKKEEVETRWVSISSSSSSTCMNSEEELRDIRLVERNLYNSLLSAYVQLGQEIHLTGQFSHSEYLRAANASRLASYMYTYPICIICPQKAKKAETTARPCRSLWYGTTLVAEAHIMVLGLLSRAYVCKKALVKPFSFLFSFSLTKVLWKNTLKQWKTHITSVL